jgi:hypothetical protein
LVSLGLLLATQVHTTSSYAQVVASIVLVGAGSGISFVSLTSASLTDVAAGDAGAASGLINVTQQIGAALGLAVLVSAFGIVTGHVQLGSHVAPAALAHAQAVMAHGLDDVFGFALVFTLAALLLIAVVIRSPGDGTPAREVADVAQACGTEETVPELAEAG